MPTECETVYLQLPSLKLPPAPAKSYGRNWGHPFNFSGVKCVRVGGCLRLRGVTQLWLSFVLVKKFSRFISWQQKASKMMRTTTKCKKGSKRLPNAVVSFPQSFLLTLYAHRHTTKVKGERVKCWGRGCCSLSQMCVMCSASGS